MTEFQLFVKAITTHNPHHIKVILSASSLSGFTDLAAHLKQHLYSLGYKSGEFYVHNASVTLLF